MSAVLAVSVAPEASGMARVYHPAEAPWIAGGEAGERRAMTPLIASQATWPPARAGPIR